MLQHQRKWFRQDIVTCCTFLLTLFGKWFIIKFRILWKMMYPRMVSKPITKTKILVPVNMWCPKYAHLEVSSLYSKSFSNCSTGWSNIKGVPFMLNNLYDNIINGRGRMNRENSMGITCTLWAHAYKKTIGVIHPLMFVGRFHHCNVFVFIFRD